MTIYFDMDGTIADLYGVENWLDYLVNNDPTPYRIAKPLVDMETFSNKLNQLQRFGYRIGIISWLSKNSNADYDRKVKEAKLTWLFDMLPDVLFDEINIVPYGTPKSTAVDDIGYLFDDEASNRQEWGQGAFDVDNLIETLSTL